MTLPKLVNVDWVEELPEIVMISGKEYEVHVPEIRDGSNELISKAEVIVGKFHFYHRVKLESGFFTFEKSKDGEEKRFPRLATFPKDEVSIVTEDGTWGCSVYWVKFKE